MLYHIISHAGINRDTDAAACEVLHTTCYGPFSGLKLITEESVFPRSGFVSQERHRCIGIVAIIAVVVSGQLDSYISGTNQSITIDSCFLLPDSKWGHFWCSAYHIIETKR